MKKLLILLSLIMLASALVFAAEVTFTGKAEYEGGYSVAGDDEDATTTYKEAYLKHDPDFRLETNIKVDDFNTVYTRFRLRDRSAQTDRYVQLDRALLTSDWGKSFGLNADQIKITSVYGLNEWDLANVGGVLGWDQGDFNKDFTVWGGKNTVSILKMVDLSFTYDLSGMSLGDGTGGDVNLYNFQGDAVVTLPAGPGTLKAEVGYARQANEFTPLSIGNDGRTIVTGATSTMTAALGHVDDNNGFMLFEASYALPLTPEFTLAAGGGYDLELSKDFASEYDFAVKGSYAVKGGPAAYAGAGIAGFQKTSGDWYEFKAEPLAWVKLVAGASYGIVGVDLGVVLYTGDNKSEMFYTLPDDNAGSNIDDYDVLNTLDISAYVKVGAASFRLGYIYVPEYTYSLDPYMTDANQAAMYFLVTCPF